MKKIFTHLFALFLLSLVSSGAWAQFQNDKVYRIVCSGTNSVSLGASALTDVAAVSTSETEKAQQWYVTVSGSNYTFRNLANGRYLLGNNGTSGEWGLTESSNNFTVSTVNGNYCIRGASDANGYAYMHKDGGNNIVSWGSGAANSQWTPIEVSYTADELQAVWDEVEALVVPSSTVSGYQEKLNAIFSDKACTKLNDTYAGKTIDEIRADANYTGLPAVLQAMVVKVYNEQSGSTTAWAESTVAPADRPNGNNNTNHNLWTVADTWDNDYAKKFRVQMYEPYSVEGEITSYLRINAHCNMDNPTGIYANAGEPMYIMVEGTIAEGAELWVAHQVGHGATNYYNNPAYTQLHEGLNVVPYFANGSQLWINYVVHTYNGSGTTIAEKFPENRQLSDYKPLKIHIEGGKINGFFNAMGDYRSTEVSGDANGGENLWGEVDNDADWNYYKQRAALSGDFALLGHRQTLLFDFGTYNSNKGHFGVANADGGIEYALAYHLENITVPATPNCYAGSGKAFGDYSNTYYPGMNLVTENGTPNKVNIMLEAWDRIQYSEHASLGLLSVANIEKMNALYPRWTTAGEAAEIYNYGEVTINNVTQTYQQFCQGIDYSEYFNHHGAAVGAGSGYMSGGWRVCNYHYNTMGSIIGKIAAEAGPTWGPAHEIGHQHQTIFNLNGQTEVTNNFHSNVAVWYMGMGTSRVNGSEGSLSSVLGAFNTDGNDLYTNNIWALTHLYYRLWLYYHLAGNNTQFWPRLFELLRQVPIVNGGQISGETSLLRFYQHACDAAGEDLTEFFRAHGFFEIMTDRLVGDYSNGTYNVTEEQIETAISAVKAKNYPVNYAVLLINDGTSETTVKHDGTTSRALWDNNPSAEYGSVTDFIEGNTDVTEYEATVSADGTVTMSGGTGGVGFLILNEKGEIVSFSNKASFEISDEAAYLLATGKASIVAVDAESKTTESEVDLSAIQREMLKALIEKIEAMPIDDGTYTHVGFYTKACAADLLAAVESSKTVLASGTGFAAAYEMLYAEKEKFVNSQNLSFVPFDPSLTYVITNCAYRGKTMHLNSGLKSATGVDQTANTARWQFKTTDTEGVYKLYNTAGYYLTAPAKSATVGSTATVGDAATFTLLQESPVGAWSISLSPAAEYTTLHDNSFGNVVGWSAGVDPSKWYLTAVEGSTNSKATQDSDELQALVAKAETLMNEVATVSLKGELQLQANNEGAAFYITSNATETGHEPKYLLDNNVSTFFHTVWWGTSPGTDHYLQIDLGEEYPIDQFVFEYTNLPSTSNNVDAAEAITVQVANALDGFTTIATLKSSDSNPLPTAKEGTYTSATLGTKDANYRYIRLIVTDATGGMLSNHYYFGMSEFSLERLNSYSKVKDAYTGHITQDVVATVADKLVDAKTAITNGGDIAAAKSNLQTAYDALKAAYDAVLDAKRTELQALIESTTTLINGTATVTPETEEKVTLTTTAGSAGYLYCNAQINEGSLGNLLVDDNSFMHTHWGSTTSADHDYHYLRVDMGEGNTIGEFSFTYTTASRAKRDMPAEIVVEGANEIDSDNSTLDTFTLIDTLTSLPEVLNTYSLYTSTILGDANTPYRYLRFKVTKNNCGELDGDSHPFFTMTRFGLTKITPATATVEDTYLDTEATPELVLATYNENSNAAIMKNIATSMAMLQTQIDELQAAYNALETARETSATPDKTALEELIAATTTLYNKMSDGNGNMNADYATSSLTAEQLTAVKAALDAAQSVVDYAGSTQLQVNEAKNALDGKYQVLVSVEDTNEKSTLATNGLTTLIGNVKTLLGTIADATASKTEIALQVSDADSEFYLWSNAPAGDSDGIAALLDNNTGTFFGTQWGSVVDAYTHYIEIDMGDAIAVDELLFGYTTRNSTHANQRPTAIKVLGSNNKVDYTEIETISDGLATEAAERWSMDTPLSLAARYRYIRFAVATQPTTGFFNMSEFDLYANIDYSLKDYYTTATGLGFVELCLALQSAEDLLTRSYITTAQYNAVYNKLDTYYTAANSVVDADVKVRSDLETLIYDTETLIEEVATVTEVVTPVLSTANLYCNADNSTNDSAGDNDKRGVAALLDGDLATHLHTTYGGNAQDDDLDHYIRVDLGEDNAVAAFEFSYTGRSNNSGNDPSTIIIQGCNTVDGEWVDIKTLTNLPTDGDKVQYSSGLIEASEAYRYIRFMVTETQNNSKTTYNNIAHPFFVMSEFSFTAHSTIEVNEGYTNVTKELVRAAYNEKNSANNVANYYMTESDYNAALAALQADYDALDAAATADKTELEELIAATTILKGQLYETVITSYTANEVTLSITEGDAGYIYCNAPEKNSTWATDNAGVAALIDLTDGNPNLETFLHTEYGNDQSADGLDHYLRVDLGADGATEYVEFGYYGRGGHLSKSPKKVIVAATNDLTDGGVWTTIATLNPAQASASTETKTGCLGNGVAYRYWRFLVEETHSGGKDGNNHQYFCMTEFNVYKCTDVVLDQQLKYSPTIYIYNTDELVTEVENAITAANSVVDNEEASQTDVNSEVEALQAVYDKLAEAINYYWCPVELTVDVANPALYIIDAIGRGAGKAWQYNAQNNNITIVNKDANNLYHLWYFMLGGEEQTVKIIPVMTPEYGLSATDFTNGINKVSAVAENCVNWSFAYVNDNYNFKPHGRNIYLSNYNGGSNPLGFYGSADGGSYVNFTAVEVEDYALTRLAKLAEGKSAVTAGTTVGSYVEATVGVYNEALEAANGMVAAASSMPQEYVNAFTRLFNANNGLRINLPDPAKQYVLRCNHESRYIYVNADNKLQWAASSYDKSQSNAVWVFEEVDDLTGTCKMKSLHTQSYLSGTSGSQWAFGEEGKVVTLVKSPSVEGALVFKVDGYENNGLHAHGENNTVISHTNDAVANHYFFEEVEDAEENIRYSVSLGADESGSGKAYSTLYLGYNATIPEGVTASVVTEINEIGQLVMEEVTGDILPAKTAVVLSGENAGGAEFKYADGEPSFSTEDNILKGTTYTKVVHCGDTSNIYMLAKKNGRVAFYWTYENRDADGNYVYINANEEVVEKDTEGAHKNHNKGGYLKCNANKAYLQVSEGTQGQAAAAMFGFHFGGNTTDIDSINAVADTYDNVYDLQGRKLEEITSPGIYIVNGKKVLVR